jgi:tetratricopeptide (TPR) repeat protein
MRVADQLLKLRREIFFLVLLSAGTAPLFFFTRAMANRNRAMHARFAQMWYEEGRKEMDAGDLNSAIDSFRKATTNDHDNPQYRLALARALAMGSGIQEARVTLLQLRETAPENGEINLDLARLEARAGDVDEAVRYYRSALYGIWPEQEIDRRRRQIRGELIGFLLDHHEANRALSELLAFSRDVPATVMDHVQVGQFFLKAQDPARALNQFEEALKLDGENSDALAGAGEAAFDTGNYRLALQYLDAAVRHGASSASAQQDLRVAKLVVSNDPLASRLSVAERTRRLKVNFDAAQTRLMNCLSQGDKTGQTPTLYDLQGAAADMESQITEKSIRSDSDMIRNVMDLAYKIETSVSGACAAQTDLDRALILIARMHGIPEGDSTSR